MKNTPETLEKTAPHFTGRIDMIPAAEIERSLEHTTRQYFAGDLKLPQELHCLPDTEVEAGISSYPRYQWEQPHYHRQANEYCYLIQGETKYINLASGKEYHFHAGDFYILRRDTPYAQKCLPGCRLLFIKVPGGNDKVKIELSDDLRIWCSAWDLSWPLEE